MKNYKRSKAQQGELKKRLEKRVKIRKMNRDEKSVQDKVFSPNDVNCLVNVTELIKNIPDNLKIATSGFKTYAEFDSIDIALLLVILFMIDDENFNKNGFFLTNSEIADELDWDTKLIKLMLGFVRSKGLIQVLFELDFNNSACSKRRISLTNEAKRMLRIQYELIGTTYIKYKSYWDSIKDEPKGFMLSNQFLN